MDKKQKSALCELNKLAHAGRCFWLVINRYLIRMCASRRRMNNEISDNNQKIMLKLRVISATIDLVKNLQVCTMVYFVEVYYFLINSGII